MSISIIGYGTFITKGRWKDKENVEPCLVRDFIRIIPLGNWFPYVLPKKGSQFWALKFDVDEKELRELDIYEGVDSGLYERKKIEVSLKDRSLVEGQIYLPTEKTIEKYNLTVKMDEDDKWKGKIRENEEIIKKFPELIR